MSLASQVKSNGDSPLEDKPDVLTLTAEIVASYVGANTHVNAAEIPNIIRQVRTALMEDVSTPQEAAPEQTKVTGAQARKSITPDALISFVDNKPYKTLKRHLARHGMSMGDYRDHFGLPNAYPSVAPNYSAARSAMAKSLGLGARRRPPVQAPAPPARARRKSSKKDAFD